MNNFKPPSKEQAIVFNAIDGVRIQDYLLNLGPLVDPKNILFCSRISNGRICVYLSSKNVVDLFMDKYGQITVQGEIAKARRLVTPTDRLVISNVCPTIPHNILKDSLSQLGLQLVSPITFLRIGATVPEYSHILSFRRQVYVAATESTIPESLEVTHDNLKYRVFLSLDSQTCFKCKLPGHIASQCPEANPPSPTNLLQQTTQHTQAIQSVTPTDKTQAHANPTVTPAPSAQPEPIVQLSNIHHSRQQTTKITEDNNTSKRGVSEILSPTAESITGNSGTPTFKAPQSTKTKKLKTDSCSSHISEEQMKPIREFMESKTSYLELNCHQLKSLLENTHGVQDILGIVNEYTTDIKSLIETLLLVYPHITDRTLKNRCTRLRKKLEHLENNTTDSLSDTSSIDSFQT
nr:unnamed protein product [Callosobruchus chinensis]